MIALRSIKDQGRILYKFKSDLNASTSVWEHLANATAVINTSLTAPAPPDLSCYLFFADSLSQYCFSSSIFLIKNNTMITNVTKVYI